MLGTPEPNQTANHTLGPANLRFAVIDCVRARDDHQTTLDKLWRETPERVAILHDAAVLGFADLTSDPNGRFGLHAERMKQLRRPLPRRAKTGKTVSEVATMTGINRETLACLLEHHGYLELVPYGGTQRRRLVTERAYAAELGHNVDASTHRIAHVEGAARACVFPVFYPECLPAILWTLNYEGIRRSVASKQSKRRRLSYLLAHHSYLPTTELASLSGYTRQGIDKRRSGGGRSAEVSFSEKA